MSSLQPHLLDHAYSVAARQVEAGTVPFAILGIADAEGVVRLEAFSPRSGPSIGTDAICLLASITKPITGTLVTRMAQDGRLSLAQPLATWLPELAAAPDRQAVTAWHVLTHTTGMADADIEEIVTRGAGRDELLRHAFSAPHETPIGSTFRYVTSTFDLLAEAVERIEGRPFEDVLRAEILDPLGMTDTTFDPRSTRRERMAPVTVGRWDGAGATMDPAAAQVLLERFVDLRFAGGGLWSTASDLLRFGRAMLRSGELEGTRILAPAFVEMATREVTLHGLGATPNRLEDDHYALGWGKPGPASPASPMAFEHGGVSGTRLWVDPAYDLVVVYLSGRWGLASTETDRVVNAVYAALE